MLLAGKLAKSARSPFTGKDKVGHCLEAGRS